MTRLMPASKSGRPFLLQPLREFHADPRKPRQRFGPGQTSWVKDQILRRFPDIGLEIKIIRTSADKDSTASIRSGGAVGVFVKELEQALLEGEIDLAVHSMKDLPTQIPRVSGLPLFRNARTCAMSSSPPAAETFRDCRRVADRHGQRPPPGSNSRTPPRSENPGHSRQYRHPAEETAGRALRRDRFGVRGHESPWPSKPDFIAAEPA